MKRLVSRFSPAALVGLALVLTGPALAAGTATFETETPRGTQTLAISWQDGETARMDMLRRPGYTMVRNGTAYAVGGPRNMPMVLQMGPMPETAAGMPMARAPGTGAFIDRHTAFAVVSLTPTGRTETLAGLTGEEHDLVWVDGTGANRTDTVVLSDDPLAVEFTQAFQAFGRAMARDEDARAAILEGRGLLRYGDSFRLASISPEAPPAEAFVLPAEPVRMQDLMPAQ